MAKKLMFETIHAAVADFLKEWRVDCTGLTPRTTDGHTAAGYAVEKEMIWCVQSWTVEIPAAEFKDARTFLRRRGEHLRSPRARRP